MISEFNQFWNEGFAAALTERTIDEDHSSILGLIIFKCLIYEIEDSFIHKFIGTTSFMEDNFYFQDVLDKACWEIFSSV